MVKKEVIFYSAVIFLAVISLNFVFSTHTSDSSRTSVNEDIYYIFNITINNTNAGVAVGNITQVNITLWGNFTFVSGSNFTNTPNAFTFTNTSTVLSWENLTNFLINGSTNNTYFSFNASASNPGTFNITVTSLNQSGTVSYQTNISITVADTTVPAISLLYPADGNTTVNPSNVAFTFTVSDFSAANCTLILNGAKINFNASVNVAGGQTIFTNTTYIVNNTWNVNCTDSANNKANSSIYTFNASSFQFSGIVKDEDGNALNNSLVNITVRQQDGFSILTYVSSTSNFSGGFNFSIPSSSSWIYQSVITHRNTTAVKTAINFTDFISKSMPAFPSSQMSMLAGTTFYLTPAATINITVGNITSSDKRETFQYQIKDTSLGYPIAEDHTNWVKEAIVNVPANRNYSIMVYPNMSMPVYFNWNNFSSTSSYSIPNTNGINISHYNATTKTLQKQFNVSMTMARVAGYVINSSNFPMNTSSFAVWTNFTVIPYLLEPGNMVHSQYGAMPYNISASLGQSDVYNLATGFFNITLLAPEETSSILLFAALVNQTKGYYGGFKNISLSYGVAPNQANITIYGLIGVEGNITMDRMDGAAQTTAINTSKQTFNLVNATNSSLTSTSAHIETTVDYSSYGATQFTWMSDIQQSQNLTNFAIPLLNVTGIKEMNVFASGGPSGGNGQYAPRRVSTITASDITANPNITMKTFNPGAIDSSIAASSISISLYASNSSCDVPNPPSSCLLTTSATMETFNPMQAVMGGGKISFRMGSGGILVHYVNVDMIASGPPDAVFENDAGTTESAGSFQNAMKFGSQGPTIYDYVLVSIPYSVTAGAGLNDSVAVTMNIPLLYDDNWNVIWNVSNNGTTASALAGNYSHYSAHQDAWGNLTSSQTCATANITISSQLNITNPCHIDNSTDRIWVRLPHFSGTGLSVSGSTLATATTTTSGTTSGGSASYDISVSNSDLVLGTTKYLGVTARFKINLLNETHYVKLDSLDKTAKTASITVSSTPQTFTLTEGETKKVNINSDNYYDLEVKLAKVFSTAGANIYVKKINEAIPAAPVTPAEEQKSTGEKVSETVSEAIEGTKSLAKSAWSWIIALVIIIVLVVVLIVFLKKKRYSKKGY